MKDGFLIKDEFFHYYQELVSDVMLPYQYAVLGDNAADADIPKSHSFENFRIAAGESRGEFSGWVFQDSDTAKWLEAAAYCLMRKPDPDLESKADAIISLVGRAQEKDGYLNTYFTVTCPERKWQNLQECHELYCAGHMIEAGVAYYEATGKTKLLQIGKRLADLIDSIFGKGEGKRDGIPGHPEIELALVRLFRVTGEQKYLALAKYFLDFRGTDPDFFKKEALKRGWTLWNMNPEDTDYLQNTYPVREEKNAVGHAVRAVYLYTGMAMAAVETKDASLADACERMWNSIVNRRMYLTGGIGSSADGEAFTLDYDLPNDTAYCETCASIGLIFFANAMLDLQHNAKYADVLELALYNTVLAGIQRDGTHFFYTNPLEMDPMHAQRIPRFRHIYPRRPKWHGCACCPPNAARLLASLDRYAWHTEQNEKGRQIFYSDLFIQGEYHYNGAFSFVTKTNYPYDGMAEYEVQTAPGPFTLAVRRPFWSKNTTVNVNGKRKIPKMVNGYLLLEDLKAGDCVQVTLDVSPHKVYANPKVYADAGKTAFMAGPLVYCFEDADNKDLNFLCVDKQGTPLVFDSRDSVLGQIRVLKIPGLRLTQPDALYSFAPPEWERCELTAIPYYTWCNRETGKMKVWMPEQ